MFHSFADVTITSDGLRLLTQLSTHDQWAVRVVLRAIPTETRPTLNNGYLREPVRLIPVAEHLAVELPLPSFLIGLSRPGIEPRSPTLPLSHRDGS